MSSDFSGRTPTKLDIEIGNNGFFPALNLGDLQERYRISSDYRQHTIGAQTVAAIIEVNRALNQKLCEWQRAGYDVLAAVPAAELGIPDQPGHIHELVELYTTAVFARAKAKLLRQYPSMNRRDRQAATPEAEETEATLLDESNEAIRLILGDVPAIRMRCSVV